MKYIIIITLTLAILISSLTAKSMSVFVLATKSGWYPQFLKPVVDTITASSTRKSILDIGTGPGTLPNMLIESDSNLKITAIDIDSSMIDYAKTKHKNPNVTFEYQGMDRPLNYTNQHFDMVTFCSVLFLVNDEVKQNLLSEALRVLKPGGKIIILTPSGSKSIISSFVEVWKYPFSFKNVTFPIWKMATTQGARKWNQESWLANYAKENQLKYSKTLVFNNNAVMEIVTKPL